MKAKMQLTFEGWKPDDEKPTLSLSATDDGPNVSTVLPGTVVVGKAKMYEILRAAKEMNKKPLFVMEIIDD